MNFTKTAVTALTALTLTSLTLTACDAKKISQPITTTHASQTMATESIVASTPTSMSAASATISTTAAKTQGIWIDVREAHEYAQGHLKDAVNITGRDLPSQIAGIAPDKMHKLIFTVARVIAQKKPVRFCWIWVIPMSSTKVGINNCTTKAIVSLQKSDADKTSLFYTIF